MDEAIWRVTSEDWARVQATHVAAQATAARVLDLEVPGEVWVGRGDSRHGHQIGWVLTGGAGGSAAQLIVVAHLAGPIAEAIRLAEMGYDEHVQASAEYTMGASAAGAIRECVRTGWVVWPRRAERDADALLGEPAVWDAVGRLTDALQQGAVDEVDLDAVIAPAGDPAALSTHPVWTL